MVKKIQTPALIGRKKEIQTLMAALACGRHVILEGPVGVGKTRLALHVAQLLKRPVFRVDGDSRYTEQKLVGWFDPPLVLKKGYVPAAFIEGPLLNAMKKGALLFINELNRLPEGVQNVLLPALDEKRVTVPHLGDVKAQVTFQVIATQNPRDFVATSHLSEALLDRFDWMQLDYQSEEEEREILASICKNTALNRAAVSLIRLTREDQRVLRGASLRAAQSLVLVADQMMDKGQSLEEAFSEAALLALPTRIELDRSALESADSEIKVLITEWVSTVLERTDRSKKKT